MDPWPTFALDCAVAAEWDQITSTGTPATSANAFYTSATNTYCAVSPRGTPTFKDGVVAVTVPGLAATQSYKAGCALRVVSSSTGYFGVLDGTGYLQLYSWSGTLATLIDESEVFPGTIPWPVVVAWEVLGSRFTGFVNGVDYLSVTDSTYTAAGRWGAVVRSAIAAAQTDQSVARCEVWAGGDVWGGAGRFAVHAAGRDSVRRSRL